MNTVLIAEDDESLRTLMRLTLETGRFPIVEAADGPSALQTARVVRPALIFIDWSMPGLSGIEVCRQLRADPATREVKVVMVTGRARETDRETGLAAGADAFIVKPFSPVELLETVRQALGAGAIE